MKSHCESRVEKLEPRTLLSAWSTVDNNIGGYYSVQGMAADWAGNVYAVGYGSGQTGIVREKLGTSPDMPGSWTTIATVPHAQFESAAVDRNGNVFIGGGNAGGATVWQLPAGAGPDGLTVVDNASSEGFIGDEESGLAVDASGNVYAVGSGVTGPTTRSWTVRKGTYDPSTNQWTFTTVDQVGPNAVAFGVTAINSGSSAGIYAVGKVYDVVANAWVWTVRKSEDGGSTWNQVDRFRYDPNSHSTSTAWAVAGDQSGNVYVAGDGTGGAYWVVRKSVDGGASWSTDDVYLDGHGAEKLAIGADLAGNMYVAGGGYDSGALGGRAIIRSNAGGRWTTVDDYPPGTLGSAGYWGGFTVDPSGNLDAGGADSNGWFIRSSPGPAPTKVTLDFNYLVTLARNYSHPGTFATGDLNGDGQVGFDDLVLLARNYGKVVSPSDFAPVTPATAQVASSPSLSSYPAASTSPTRTHHPARHRFLVP